MPQWTVEDRLEVELEEEVREARIRVGGGEVSVTAADGRPRLEVVALRGGPVDVHLELGALRVYHPQWAWSGWRRLWEGVVGGPEVRVFSFRIPRSVRPECSVTLALPSRAMLDVSTVSAPVLASGLGGPVRLKTVSGDLTLNDLGDVVEAATVSGDVAARGLGGDLRVKTVSGEVTVSEGTCRWVDAKTVSGDVLLDLDLDPAGVYEVVTVSGDVSLRLPAEPNAVVEAVSVAGDLDSDFDLRWDHRGRGARRLRQRLGEGAARVFLKTVSGDLRVVARRAAA